MKYAFCSVLVWSVCVISCLSSVVAADDAPTHSKRVVCYLASWGVNIPGNGKFTIEDAKPVASICTHIVYLFVGLDPNTNKLKSLSEKRDFLENDGEGGIPELVRLKEEFPHLKVMVAIGGWNEGSITYSKMVSHQGTRGVFIKSAVEFLRKHKLDGLDIDWQFPGDRGGVPADKGNLVLLVKELRKEFDKYNLILSVAVSCFPHRIAVGVDIAALTLHADFVTVLTFEYNGHWDTVVGSGTPLRGDNDRNIANTIKVLKDNGAITDKLLLGLSGYGMTFITTEIFDPDDVMGQPCEAEKRFRGPFHDTLGFMGYNEVCLEFNNQSTLQKWDKASSTPYLVNGDHVVSYDNEKSIAEKVRFMMDEELGGVLFYSLDKDDFHGDCSDNPSKNYPLLRTIGKSLEKLAPKGKTSRSPGHSKKVMCYMASWGTYIQGRGRFVIENAEPVAPICTHLVYLFVGLDPLTNKLKSLNEQRDFKENNGQGGLAEMVALKNFYPHLKVMVSIGGWNEGSVTYSAMVTEQSTREIFVKSVVDFLLQHELDGLDIDWQFPGDRGGAATDKENLVLLAKELREEFDQYGFYLSVAVSCFPHRINIGVDIAGLTKYAHSVSVLTFEYNGHWDTIVGPGTPLKGEGERTISNTISYLLEQGGNPEKILLGLSGYGMTFITTEVFDPDDVMGQPCEAEKRFRGPYHDTLGFIAYNELCLEFQNKSNLLKWHEESVTPYLVNGDHVVSYDNERSITEKVKFAVEKKLGGVLFYSLDKDDFLGDCEEEEGLNYPLMRTVSRTLEKLAPKIQERKAPLHRKKVVCYMAGWGIYISGKGQFLIEDVIPAGAMCTHLVYLFVGLDPETNEVKSLNADRDFVENGGKGGLAEMVALKDLYPDLKVMVSIGGWNEGSLTYSKMSSQRLTRNVFINSAVKFLKDNQLDGLDIDWQFPGDRGGVPADKQNFVQLVKEIREEFNKHDLVISVAVSALPHRIAAGVDIAGLTEHAHHVSVLTYEYNEQQDSVVGPGTPIRGDNDKNIASTIRILKEGGAKLENLLLGVSGYGTTFVTTQVFDPDEVMGKTCDGERKFKGPYHDTPGFMAYNEICLEFQNTSHAFKWHELSVTPYLVDGDRVVSYDDEKSVEEKVKFAMTQELGGVLFYSLDKDDFHGDCSKDGAQKYPLMKTIDKTLEKLAPKPTNAQRTAPAHEYHVVCYISSWSNTFKGRGKYDIPDVEPALRMCTHVVYTFVGINRSTNEIMSLAPDRDFEDNGGQGGIPRLVAFKEKYPHLKVMVAIGGWVEGSVKYSKMASSPSKRFTFIQSVVQFLKEHNLDGLEFNWQFPGDRGASSSDKKTFVDLMKELREEFDKYNLIISAAISAVPLRLSLGIDIANLSKYAHYISVMTYEYTGYWERVVRPSTPLRGENSIETTIRNLKEQGAHPDKLLMAVSNYGTTFITQVVHPPDQVMGQLTHYESFWGPYNSVSGLIGYNEMCIDFNKTGVTLLWDDPSQTAYMVTGDRVICYDNERSIREKIKFAINEGLKGIMYYALEKDDFIPDCSAVQYPLLKAIDRTFEELTVFGLDELYALTEQHKAIYFWNAFQYPDPAHNHIGLHK